MSAAVASPATVASTTPMTEDTAPTVEQLQTLARDLQAQQARVAVTASLPRYLKADTPTALTLALSGWVAKNVPAELINWIPAMHTTIAFGVKESGFDNLKKHLKPLKGATMTIPAGALVRQGDEQKNRLLVEFECPQLDEVRKAIMSDPEVFDGRGTAFANHFSLVICDQAAVDDDRFKALVGTVFTETAIVDKISCVTLDVKSTYA